MHHTVSLFPTSWKVAVYCACVAQLVRYYLQCIRVDLIFLFKQGARRLHLNVALQLLQIIPQLQKI